MVLVQQEFNMEKIDVCVNVFGKPYQTLITLKSLLQHSGKHIDKIYFIEEKIQAPDYNFDIIKNNLSYPKLERYIPKYYLGINKSDVFRSTIEKDYRLSLRYQYGLENTNKKHLLIIHNDVLFNGDIVSELLNEIGDCFSIGHIGQCWNCPLKSENVCDGDLLESNIEKKFSYDQIIGYVNKHRGTRTFNHGREFIDVKKPLPMPECRVNEWCTLINVNHYRKECIPNGDVSPFGGYFGIDLADIWFKQMVHKGYKFKHYDIYKSSTHGYFSEVGHGNSAMYNKNMYDSDEQRAKEYLKTHYS